MVSKDMITTILLSKTTNGRIVVEIQGENGTISSDYAPSNLKSTSLRLSTSSVVNQYASESVLFVRFIFKVFEIISSKKLDEYNDLSQMSLDVMTVLEQLGASADIVFEVDKYQN